MYVLFTMYRVSAANYIIDSYIYYNYLFYYCYCHYYLIIYGN